MTDAPSTLLARGSAPASGEGARPGARELTATIATGDMLDVRRFQVTERMSALFEVHLVAVSDNPDIDFEGAIGLAMSFSARLAGQGRVWTGICSHLRQIAVEERHLSTYELTLVPTLWLATQRRNHRMFQQQSEIDIVLKLLGEWGISPTLKLGGTYRKRKVRVQYGESDHAFISRLLEDAGVSFYFDEGVLVLDDGPQHNAARAPIAFRDHPMATDQEYVTEVQVGRRLRPGKYTVRDHDYRRPPAHKLLQSADVGGVEARLERFHYVPGAFLYGGGKGDPTPHADDKGMYRTDEAEGKKLAERRLEAKRASAREVSFLTSVLDPAPGVVVTFLDHPKSELGPGKRLLVVASRLSGEVPGLWTHACDAVSAEAAYRPPLRARKPRVHGVESATVVGPPGEEIHVDEFGRVRVHFHWDRESKMNDASSVWIHVSQPWGGASFGGTNLPRVGQEVVVDFLGADPDRPIIVGRVYTSLQKTPYTLPENKTQSGWKSASTPATGGFNEIMFEDAAGRELVRMQAERDLHKKVKNDQQGWIGNNLLEEVVADERRVTGGDRGRAVGGSEQIAVAQDRNVSIGQCQTTTVLMNEDVDVGQNFTGWVGQDADLTVCESLTKYVGENERETTGQGRSVSIGQNLTVTVGQSRTSDVTHVDSTSVGDRFHVEVKVPAAHGAATGGAAAAPGGAAATPGQAAKPAAAKRAPTSQTMTDQKIVFTTGKGATITLEGSEIRLEATVIKVLAKKRIVAEAHDEDIRLHAHKDLNLRSDHTLHAATKAGVLALQAAGGNVTVDTDHSVVVKAKTDVTADATNVKLYGSRLAELNAGIETVVSSHKHTLINATQDTSIAGRFIRVQSEAGTVIKATESGEVLIKGPTVNINP